MVVPETIDGKPVLGFSQDAVTILMIRVEAGELVTDEKYSLNLDILPRSFAGERYIKTLASFYDYGFRPYATVGQDSLAREACEAARLCYVVRETGEETHFGLNASGDYCESCARVPASSSGGIAVNQANFPDDTFLEYVAEEIDLNGDMVLSAREISAVEEIDVSEMDIRTLKGIEYITNLTRLNCSSNELTSLDVSKNTSLMELDCYWNQLTELDVSSNRRLNSLRCFNNPLTSLDVSQNPELISLDCAYCQLISLDVRNNKSLQTFICGKNQLTSLDVSQNEALNDLYCNGNQLTSLDVSENKLLEYLTGIDNERKIEAEKGVFDLSALPGFDVSKASLWQGGTVSGSILTVAETGKVTYTYDCGNDYSENFTLNVTVTGNPAPSLTDKPGNVTGDENGAVDGQDALLLSRYLLGESVSINEKAADVNGDGAVDGRDLLHLLRYLAGQIEAL